MGLCGEESGASWTCSPRTRLALSRRIEYPPVARLITATSGAELRPPFDGNDYSCEAWRERATIFLMLSLIFLIVFPFAVYKAWQNVQMAKASVNWPTTTGRVTASDVKKVVFRRQPQISYAYSVNGTAYV